MRVIQDAEPASLAPFDAIIDVRSPSEFAEDHVPGAISLPVLSDAERAEVGTIYVQESRLRANRIGAAHVARNIARHLETAMSGWPAGFAPLVYCWRGGQRSESMATVLSRVGWAAAILAGGYRTYRGQVQARLYQLPLGLDVVLLDGDTGSAKTEILARLGPLGIQTLDLEDLAGHRGSLFGARAGRPQPSQKMFETRLLQAVRELDPGRPVVVEAESSKIGERMIPPSLWRLMQAARRVEIVAPRTERARYLVAAYADIVSDREALEAAFHRLPVYPGQRRLEDWRRLACERDFLTLAEALMELHYDPAYARGRRKDGREPWAQIILPDLSQGAQDEAAGRIAAALGSRS